MKIKIVVILIAVAGLFHSCSTDFDINADWQDIAVVYSILNQNDTTNYVKLNRVFLGEADAYVMAQEADSIFYDTAIVFIEPLSEGENLYNQQGDLIRYPLYETYDIEKDSGIFSNEYNRLYATDEFLDPRYDYQLAIEIPGRKEISAVTSLIKGLTVTKPTTNPNNRVSFANIYDYMNYSVEIQTSDEGELYGLTVRFHWQENTPDGVEIKSLDWVQPTKKKQYDVLSWDLSGESFYAFLNNNIEEGDPTTTRVCLGLDFIFVVAGEELASYVEVNGPSNGIIQEKPAFTNIVNGIGVFSSRFNKTIPMKQLSTLSLDQLACSDYTRHLRFEDSNHNVGACD